MSTDQSGTDEEKAVPGISGQCGRFAEVVPTGEERRIAARVDQFTFQCIRIRTAIPTGLPIPSYGYNKLN